MDIEKLLLQAHNKNTTNKIVDYVGVNKSRFKQLVNLYLAGPYRLTQRAAWPLSYCTEAHPSLIYPHLSKLIQFLRRPGIPVAVKRNTMRLLQFIDIPLKNRDEVIDLCFTYLQDKKETVAVKAFSMTVLAGIIQEEPDLKKELRIILEDHLPYATPGFRSRATKILASIKE